MFKIDNASKLTVFVSSLEKKVGARKALEIALEALDTFDQIAIPVEKVATEKAKVSVPRNLSLDLLKQLSLTKTQRKIVSVISANGNRMQVTKLEGILSGKLKGRVLEGCVLGITRRCARIGIPNIITLITNGNGREYSLSPEVLGSLKKGRKEKKVMPKAEMPQESIHQ